MRLRLSKWLLLLLTTCTLAGFSEADETKKPVIASYMWNSEQILSNSDAILEFLRKQSVNLLYLRFDTRQPADKYRGLIRSANGLGIEIHALGGKPEWALETHRSQLSDLIGWVQRYNESAAEEEQIRGIHLVIEPYLLPQWKTDKEAVIHQWAESLRFFVNQSAQSPALQTSAAFPVWLDNYAMPGQPDMPYILWAMSKLDHVTLLAYRNYAEGGNGIAGVSERELNYADSIGKPLIVAVNMKPSNEGELYTFHGKSAEYTKRELERASKILNSHPSFSGLAVHDLSDWLNHDASRIRLLDRRIKGTYVWNSELVLKEQEQLIDFAKANGVNLLYVQLDLRRPAADYRPFMREAAQAGIEVHALGGRPFWALAENRDLVLSLVRYVKEYNRQAALGERFAGIHLDIEPHVLPEWHVDRETILRQWTDNIRAFAGEVKTDASLESSVSLPFWFDRYPVPSRPDMSLSRWTIGTVDHVTVMAYRNYAEGAGGIVDLVQDELQYAGELGKKIIISVEIKENFEADYVSFFHKGRNEMNRQLALAATLLEGNASFRGFVVHAYEYWKNAKE